MKVKAWYVYRINCDCAGYHNAWRRRQRGRFARCVFCRRPLGDVSLDYMGEFKAACASEAIKMATEPETGAIDSEFQALVRSF